MTEDLRRQVHYTIAILFSERLLTFLENCSCHSHHLINTSTGRYNITAEHLFNILIGFGECSYQMRK